MKRDLAGQYTEWIAQHQVTVYRQRFGDWAGWWTLLVEGEPCGWYFETKWQAVAEVPRYVEGFMRR